MKMTNKERRIIAANCYKKILVRTYEEYGGTTVEVYVPLAGLDLPKYEMDSVLDLYAANTYTRKLSKERESWYDGNPDYGYWDALVKKHYVPSENKVEVYFCALFVRPASKEAYDKYNELMVGSRERLSMMWDSRLFDTVNGFPVKI